MNALPPLPSAWGAAWRDRWRARLEATPVWLFEWARQQRDGPYWRRGSLAPDYGRIEAAILHLGAGWTSTSMPRSGCRRAARALPARRTIVGPWVHGLPDHAYPAPNIDWLREMVRWFDRWLKDERTAPTRSPRSPGSTATRRRPSGSRSGSTGEWRATPAWPPAAPASVTLHARGAATRRTPVGWSSAASGAGHRHLRPPPDGGRPRRLAVLGRRASTQWPRRRPSPRGRHGPRLHGRAAARARRRPRRARRDASCHRDAARRPPRGSARGRRAGRRRRAGQPRGSST